MSALRAGAVRGVLAVGAARADGRVPVQAAVTFAPADNLTRVVWVPEADVSSFRPRMNFVYAFVGTEVHVAALGRDAVEMLSMAGAA